MRALIVEPYLAGSHAAWAREYAERSRHDVSVLSLPGRHWKWRMHGGAVTLARRFLAGSYDPEIIVATDMLDLSTFLALTRSQTAEVRSVCYLHENQLTYPWSEGDADRDNERDVHYGFINLASALAADRVAFNSEYHRRAFLGDLESFLNGFPDYNEIEVIRTLETKSSVLYLGLDLARFDSCPARRREGLPALILWNHRWEYDKNPDDFFRALVLLQDEGLDFEVAVLGKPYARRPPVFEWARSRLGDRVVYFGYVEDPAEYASWLWRADILPVTSVQDFFGVSVVEALYCNCYPILPRRLAYPEHFVPGGTMGVRLGVAGDGCDEGRFFYDDFEGLLALLRWRIADIGRTRTVNTQDYVRRYDWSTMAPEYDAFLGAIAKGETS